jgi:hypothetical protein
MKTARTMQKVVDGVEPMNASPSTCNMCGPWWRLPLLLAAVLAAVWLLRGRNLQEQEPGVGKDQPKPAAEMAAAGQVVTLAVDYGDGRREQFASIPWRQGMTVLDVTREAPRTNAQLEIRGSGESAFVASIDSVANEGADGRNWMYSVNGKVGDRSSAIYELRPRDEVLWSFAKPK